MGAAGPQGRRDSRSSVHTHEEDASPSSQAVQVDDRNEDCTAWRTDPITPMIPHPHSLNERTPVRSFYHRSFLVSLDAGQYSSQGVRERTAELASLAVSDGGPILGGSLPGRGSDGLSGLDGFGRHQKDLDKSSGGSSPRPEPIEELPEPLATSDPPYPSRRLGTSALTTMILNSTPREEGQSEGPVDCIAEQLALPSARSDEERTSLMQKPSVSRRAWDYGTLFRDVEDQSPVETPALSEFRLVFDKGRAIGRTLVNTKSWDKRTIWQKGVAYPASLLPAVLLGLLLNILDALSYGLILFPLGQPIFADLGPDGISMFYVSTIISQLVFSCGGSIFKGGIGSEMIEVVPFFHNMAFMIIGRVGAENVKSVLATTILSYAISSILTGTVFFIMGAWKLGSLIGFFPRHILIGCIGGVGWFLVATAVTVAARIDGNLTYDLTTLSRLFQIDTVFLWTTPLAVAIGVLVLKRFIKSHFLVGGYFLSVWALFYIIKFISGVSLQTLRDSGWVFDAPGSTNPWYHFYELYDFSAVNWEALLETVPAMFALTFFGVLHVPINVPALGISTGEDNLNVDRELIAHGISNALSGFAGSIQNYLVYTNSLLFIASGGDSRLAGIMLAIATGCVLVTGPVIIGYIPIMVVGALIYMLGIELLEEALVDTLGKLHRLEYLTVVIIIIAMSAWDFVMGIVVGIILACVNFVVQTSRKSAIAATYSGQVAVSTVRRHPVHVRYLKEAGKQTSIIKLAGYLFFGTIVNVEKTIRGLIDDKVFTKRPIRFLVLDLSRVNGLDFSAAEAFTRLSRILQKRRVQMMVCGIDLDGEVGKGLQNVGLFEKNQVQIFENLNSALEYCENELLKVLYDRKDSISTRNESYPSPFLEVSRSCPQALPESLINSPRGRDLHHIASKMLHEEGESNHALVAPSRWATYQQPLPLLLQTFQGLTSQSEDFWFPAVSYFTRTLAPASSVLYRKGESPKNFYLLESGMLRAEYETPQGSYFELIVAGRPCGELPFFGETKRTATVRAEQDCVVWCLSAEKWQEVREKEPMIAHELLRVCLKLTSERMDSITSYVLTSA